MHFRFRLPFLIQLIIVMVASVVFWVAVHSALDTSEVWDSDGFVWAYPSVIALAALFGAMFPRYPILWGLTAMFAELGVMLWQTGAGPLLLVGIFFLLVLAIFPVIAACAASRFAKRRYWSGPLD